MEGSFKNLGKFATNMDLSITLTHSPRWSNAKKAWERLSIQHQPVDQAAATTEDIKEAVALAKSTEVKAFIMLMWLTAGRKGDVLQLKPEDLQFTNQGEFKGRLLIFVQEGKGVLSRKGKYHISTHCPEEWSQFLQDFVRSRRSFPHLFSKQLAAPNNREVIDTLQGANPQLTCRATRRGALQLMAECGTSEEIMMRISGHRSVNTLHRYLDWDRVNKRMHAQAQAAARHLTKELSRV